jgi:hypothetical protein
MKRQYHIVLDRDYEKKVLGYWLYRSREKNENGGSLISGVYVEREELGKSPPVEMVLTLET